LELSALQQRVKKLEEGGERAHRSPRSTSGSRHRRSQTSPLWRPPAPPAMQMRPPRQRPSPQSPPPLCLPRHPTQRAPSPPSEWFNIDLLQMNSQTRRRPRGVRCSHAAASTDRPSASVSKGGCACEAAVLSEAPLAVVQHEPVLGLRVAERLAHLRAPIAVWCVLERYRTAPHTARSRTHPLDAVRETVPPRGQVEQARERSALPAAPVTQQVLACVSKVLFALVRFRKCLYQSTRRGR
jgi:hypothetical protein